MERDRMTEKRFTKEEIIDIVDEVFKNYVLLFQDDKMKYAEFVLVENILIKLQIKFNELSKGDVE